MFTPEDEKYYISCDRYRTYYKQSGKILAMNRQCKYYKVNIPDEKISRITWISYGNNLLYTAHNEDDEDNKAICIWNKDKLLTKLCVHKIIYDVILNNKYLYILTLSEGNKRCEIMIY